MRFSAKTRSWEKAEELARKYEIAATTCEGVERTSSLPTVKEAVNAYLAADAEARGLAEGTIDKLRQVFKKQLAGFADQRRFVFLRDFNPRNLTEWRSSWTDRALSKKNKFERVVGFFWFCVRQGWIRDNPTASMGRIIARHVPPDYFTSDEYTRIISATYRLDEFAERSWGPEKRGIRIRALTELMRWSGLRIRDAATLECSRLVDNKLICSIRPRPSSPTGSVRISGSSPWPTCASPTELQSEPTATCSAIPSRSRCCLPGFPSIRFRSWWATQVCASPKSTTRPGCAPARTSSKRVCDPLGNCCQAEYPPQAERVFLGCFGQEVSNGVQGETVETVVETPSWLRAAEAIFTEAEREAIVEMVAADPECGDLMPGTGGFRKVRVGRGGLGKRGGARVIYILRSEAFPIFLITVYAKNEKKNLTKKERNELAKRADEIFARSRGRP
jgi:hypothetical protein